MRSGNIAIVFLSCVTTLGAASCSSEEATDGSDGSGTDDAGNAGDGSGRGDDGMTTGDGPGGQGDSGAGDAAKPLGAPRVYVGSSDGKIYVYAFDTNTYALTLVDATAAGTTPSFLALDPTRRFVYSIDEGNAQVRSFSVDPATGKLAAIGQPVSSAGDDPAHVYVDRAGGSVMVANYGGGTIAVLKRNADGTLVATPTATRSFGGSAETHEIVTDPTNTFVLVPNKGLDAVAVFRFAATGGTLTDAGSFAAGDGARHIDFDPTGHYAYVVNENDSMVNAFSFNASTGALTSLQPPVSALPSGFSGSNTGAEIQVTPDGRHVLSSNRGDDSLAVFTISATDGTITRTGRVATGGTSPRHFSIDPTGRFLFVGNQGSGTVVVMTMDAATGVPTPVGSPLSVTGPAYVGLFYIDP